MTLKLMVINPNDSTAMRDMITHSCNSVIADRIELLSVCGLAGVASIEGFYDGAMASSGVLQQIATGEAEGCQGYLIACADDTGLHAARELATGPVIGIGEAAMHAASMLGCGFSILTAQRKSIRILERNAREYGFADHCLGVHALDMPVLHLEDAADSSLQSHLIARAQQVVESDHSEVLVLGCAGLTYQQAHLQQALGLPVVDGVTAGILQLEALVRAGLKTSKVQSYQSCIPSP